MLAGNHSFSNEESRDMNRQSLAVRELQPDFDDVDSSFFAPRRGSASYVSDERLRILDETIEAHGIKNTLCAMQLLLEQRVEDGVMDSTGDLLLHLSRHNAYARVAERVRDLICDPEVANL